ncbi:MAG: creatininase family protein [Armatimonadota bacterium]|nr:creatininase family protein [Armatimonadota bacterium]MDR7485977.1 creatininase family protein [Armatimonadota bacterium]MDR7534336.1 creatininase family protein [Armatimonadota bacterium]MDR7536904.1 creatininase family protein [Armatimonadota bacterium]
MSTAHDSFYLHDVPASGRKRNLMALSYAEVAARLGESGQDIVMIPLGSTEKHGAHIPLGTDSYITMTAVVMASEMADCLYTPLVPFGYSPHHMGRLQEGAGTVTLRAETYRRIMHDVALSLIFHGFSRLVFVSHHGSNTKPIDELLRYLRYRTGAFVAFYKTPTEREIHVLRGVLENPPEETPGWHSSELETSCVMAVHPALVDMQVAVADRAHAPRWMGPAFSKTDGVGTVAFQQSENIWVPMEHHEYSDTATIGNPFRASAAKGEEIFRRMARHLADFIVEARRFPVEIVRRDFPERAYSP